ncbi:MAG: UDP-N-acetylmuramate--L-alanine ligase [Bacteroidota bacterium]|nr:UDP-N-acetylmuramate--L-alanine ligase [Bacteroidota bacterium]MDP4211247.1 UDP-N-acetylmuramate--L-alanine ligase [Bacteroidota bacterium]MDP4250433.1 UDP-N-acetylmuramate--L-alanine ligase [Bacteroidota bacterium]
MVDLKNIKAVYFIGIGGIGMSALARYFRSQGKKVRGYDKTETALTKQLMKEGIGVEYVDNPDSLPKDVQLVVYTPAIPGDHLGLQYYRDHGYELLKRSDVLGLVTAGSLNVCVAGTHGKTTISTLIAHILRDSGFGCNAFLGGISANYDTNFWSNERNVCVVEADEYDRSFLKLHPDIAVISSMDADHLDIYGTAAAVEEAFIDFSRKIKAGGTLISKYGLPIPDPEKSIRQIRYGLNDHNADVYAENIRIDGGSYVFNMSGKVWSLKGVKLNIGGWHNIENALAAMVVSKRLGLSDGQILRAVDHFRGVKRRFEYHTLGEGTVYIDDYAHHPKELSALISSAKELFPGRRCAVIFQPHLFSRTRDFAAAFARSLDMADEVILLPIYPARELPIEGISSATILDKMTITKKQILDKQQLLDWVKRIRDKEKLLLITAGAGDIDTLVKPLADIVKV